MTKNKSVNFLLQMLGCFISAAGIYSFAVASEVPVTGVAGICAILYRLFGIPMGLSNVLINIPIILCTYKLLGKSFFIRSVCCMVLFAVFTDYLLPLMPVYQGDRLLAALFGGVLSGAGMALIFIRGATTGGVDIISRLLRKKWPHLPMGRLIMFCDLVVVVMAWLVYGNMESALYAMIVIFVSGQVIDYIMYGTGNGKMLFVVTTHANEIAGAVTREMHRGVSILPVRGGYTGEDKNMLICAVRSSEVARLSRIIRRIDQNPFIVVAEAGEILGEGFKMGEDPV
mgnify:CR=1 FL=1